MGINFRENQARLEQAVKIGQDLERVLKEQEQLISGTKAAVTLVVARYAHLGKSILSFKVLV